ncbi:VOC family protein [Promicromonospora iranensis]|uniref:Catechol 2,3-dioxygenase-like lactoylglutathione lyase family enzyme n=1 Tax=Promicromonospora iranensis TaxID=1105144 RepID=A0ABU2CHJ0_9MICO|nr:VOC family protein [Promicromonospora iranensis]MDR7380802.1 catechol 2,3-dioxygenase-like lactoylglutathione lyase family enzyme [Promicromonospora iranensis]
MLRLSDVTYLVLDHDEAIAFFVEALGFVVRQDETDESGWRRVVVGPGEGGTGLVLALSSGAGTAGAVGRQAGGDVAFFLETDDFAAQHARMTAAGVRFREEPRHEVYGTVAVFEDLYGMPWDLIEPPADA